MPRILFIAAHRPGRSPSQRYRFEQFAPYWKQQGWEADQAWLIDAKDDALFYAPGRFASKLRIALKSALRRWQQVRRAGDYDLVFVQREAFMTGSTYFERALQRSGVPVLYDFDDAIWRMDVSAGNKRLAWLKNPGKTAELVAMADHVIAGNSYLANYARHHNSHTTVIPSVIDTERYQPIAPPTEGPVRIVWTGSHTTIRHFELALPVLRRLKARFGNALEVLVIGAPGFQDEAAGVRSIPWRAETEAEDLAQAHIGIMPLPDDEWSRGKCALKGLQYMASGMPAVMAAVGVNTEVVEDGVNGFTVGTEAEWEDRLSSLVQDGDLRRRLGAAARKTVEERYSVKAWRDTYLRLFNQLITDRTHGNPEY